MKKIVSLVAMIVILLAFTIATSGCGGNRNQYFVETDEIVEVENNAEIEIKELFVEKEPEFYNPDIYMDKNELFPINNMEFSESGDVKIEVSYYGCDLIGVNYKEKRYDRKHIIVDKNKYVEEYEEVKVFDKNNSLGYSSNSLDNHYQFDGIVRCKKLMEEKAFESWLVKLPFEKNRICQRALGNNLIVYGQKDIMLIDTANIKITNSYKLKEDKLEILHIIPQGSLLWIFCVKKAQMPVGLFGNTGGLGVLISMENEKFYDNPDSTVFVVDTSEGTQSASLFKEHIAQVKYDGNILALTNNDDIFIIDENLNTKQYKLSELLKGASFLDLFRASRHLNIETDCIGVQLNNKKYVLNIENPSELIEIPEGLMNINYNYRGYDWDYCYKKDGYYYGYNIYTKETTWKFKTESIYDTPLYSTDNGIFLGNWYMDKQKFIVTSYGENK